MNSERIKEIQEQTAYPESVSVMIALKQVWNECEQEQLAIQRVTQQSEPLVAFMKYYKNNVPIGTQKSSVEIVKDYLATNGG